MTCCNTSTFNLACGAQLSGTWMTRLGLTLLLNKLYLLTYNRCELLSLIDINSESCTRSLVRPVTTCISLVGGNFGEFAAIGFW